MPKVEIEKRLMLHTPHTTYSVCQDADGLWLVELRVKEDGEDEKPVIVLDRTNATVFANLILEFCKDDRNFQETDVM